MSINVGTAPVYSCPVCGKACSYTISETVNSDSNQQEVHCPTCDTLIAIVETRNTLRITKVGE